MHRVRFVLFWLVVVVCAAPNVIPARSQEPDSEITAWLQAHVIPLNTIEPSGNDEDLRPLKGLIGDARIVALGEATHGTHEFFTIKHRMVEFLVQEMGFTIFAIEANLPEAERINHYVQTGEGNPTELLVGLHFWTWNTQEVLDLIEWLRQYNADPKHPKVSFAGFDAQYMDVAVEHVLSFLLEVAPEDADLAATRYECLETFHLLDEEPALLVYSQLPLSETQPCGDSVRTVYDDLVRNETLYTSTSSEAAYRSAVRNALTVVQAEEGIAGRYTSGPNPRDRYMAENVSWLLEQGGPDAKIILWAHNGHIAIHGESNMGSRLEEQYGDAYVPFGFSFDRGSFNARAATLVNGQVEFGELSAFEIEPAPDDAFGAYFRQADIPAFILDLRNIDYGQSGAKWLRSQHSLRSIGAVYDPAQPGLFFTHTTLKLSFDFVIFIEETTPSYLLPPFSTN